jgi:type I restriction enzyme R subunit
MLVPETTPMKSQNFEFLRGKRSNLSDLAGFAEQYAHSDPASSLIKQRSFIEHTVLAIYGAYRLEPPLSDNLNDLLIEDSFKQAVPVVVQDKLHFVRKAGNHAAHPRRPITSKLSLDGLAELYDIARWLHIQIDRGDRLAIPVYVPPPPEPVSASKTKDALEKLRLAEAKYESVLEELEKESKKRLAAERLVTEHATELAQKQLQRARRSPLRCSSTRRRRAAS